MIETDDNRTYFLLTIPCREDMIGLNDADNNNHNTTTISSPTISSLLENRLANRDLQVYIANIEDFEGFKSRLESLISQVYLQVWEKAKTNQSLLIADVVLLFLRLSNENITSGQLLSAANVDSLYKLKRYILEPAISAGYIEMSNPDKPISSKQNYRLTQSGLNLFNK